jgi:hypothetical protein
MLVVLHCLASYCLSVGGVHIEALYKGGERQQALLFANCVFQSLGVVCDTHWIPDHCCYMLLD